MNKKRNIIITGCSGFVGSALHAFLEKEGHNVVGLSKSNGNDVTLDETWKKFSHMPIDFVYHLCGKVNIERSWSHPGEFYHANLLGTQKALDFCREKRCKMLYTSTYVYGVPQYMPIDEDHPVSPNSPYTHSKYLGEAVCRFYKKNYHVHVNIVRPFNIYGYSQRIDFIIPKLIRAALNRETVQIRSLRPKRDFLYIDDAVEALSFFLYAEDTDIYNLGYGESFSVADVIACVEGCIGKKLVVTETGVCLNGDVDDIVANTKKIKRVFNWTIKNDLMSGIRKMLAQTTPQ